MMILMLCEVCGEGTDLHEAVAEWQLSQGRLRWEEVQTPTGVEVSLVGTCIFCQARSDKLAGVNQEHAIERQGKVIRFRRERGSVGQETTAISERLRELQKEHPDWSQQRCSTQAVAEHNAIDNEPNAAFRAYLMGQQQ
jgi:hypothetical protein